MAPRVQSRSLRAPVLLCKRGSSGPDCSLRAPELLCKRGSLWPVLCPCLFGLQRILGFVGLFHLESRLCVTDQGDGVGQSQERVHNFAQGCSHNHWLSPNSSFGRSGANRRNCCRSYTFDYIKYTRVKAELMQPSKAQRRGLRSDGATPTQPINKRTHKILL